MANTDFGILLKTLLDKSGINSELEQVQKIVNKYSIDIMPELKTASLRNQMKAVSQEIANDFNKAFGTNLTGKDVFKAYENQAKQAKKALEEQEKAIKKAAEERAKAIEEARKAQEKHNEAVRKGKELAKKQADDAFTSKQTAIYDDIKKNQSQIYSLKQKLLSADKLETEEINKQIGALELKNKYNNRKLSKNGMVDYSLEKSVQESREVLENQYKIADTRKQDNVNAKETSRIAKESAKNEKERLEYIEKQKALSAKRQSEKEDARIKEANSLLSQQKNVYQEIWNINKQISSLDVDKDANQISALNEKKKIYQETYLSIQKQLQGYVDIISNEERMKVLAEVRKKTESEIAVIKGKQSDNANEKESARITKEIAQAEKERLAYIEKQKSASAKAQSNKENARIQEANSLLSQQKSAYQEIWNIHKKISSLDPNKDSEQISALNEKKKIYQDIFISTKKQLNEYVDIVSNEERLISLAEIRKKAEKEIAVIKGKQLDNSNAKESARIAKETAQAEKERLSVLEKQRAVTANSAKEKAKSNAQQELAQQKEINAILSRQESAYKEIWNINKQIATLDPTKNSNQINALNEKKKFYQEIYISAQKELQAYNNIAVSQEHLASLAEIRKRAESEIGVTVARQIEALARTQAEQVNKIQLSFDNGHGDSEYKNRIQSLVNDFEKYGLSVDEANKKTSNLRTILDGFKVDGNFLPDDQLVAQADKFETEFKAVKVSLDSAKLSFDKFLQPVSSEKASALIIKINDFLTKNTAITKEAKEELQGYVRLLQSGNVNLSDWNKFDTRLKEINQDMRVSGRLGKNLKQTLIEGAKSFAQWTLSSGAVMEVVQTVKTLTNNVIELDNKLLELVKVSDLTADGLEKATERAYKLGDTVGKTGTQVIGAVTEFKRAGYNMEESFDMAEAALVMTNVAEGITETSDAAGTLISVLKGFNMADSEAMSIVDMINATSNASPIGFDQLAEGLERTAGTLAQSGNTIQQTIGLLTAGYAQLRNVEKVSQGLITISARIRGVGEDGETIDGLSSKMSEDFGKIGVAVENADGSLRSIYQIAQDYSKVLPTLTDKQKQYYAELAAGKHQVTVWNSIVKQFKDAENATTQAINSVGSASEENQKYLDSISGKISIFNSSVEDLSNTLLNSNIIKFFIDLGTVGVKATDGLISSLDFLGGSLGTLATIGSGVLGAMGHGLTNYVTNIIVYKSPFRKQYNNAILLT